MILAYFPNRLRNLTFNREKYICGNCERLRNIAVRKPFGGAAVPVVCPNPLGVRIGAALPAFRIQDRFYSDSSTIYRMVKTELFAG